MRRGWDRAGAGTGSTSQYIGTCCFELLQTPWLSEIKCYSVPLVPRSKRMPMATITPSANRSYSSEVGEGRVTELSAGAALSQRRGLSDRFPMSGFVYLRTMHVRIPVGATTWVS